MTPEQMGEVLNSIDPTLSYEGFDSVDIVVEAVVENPKVKHAVLAETEKHIRRGRHPGLQHLHDFHHLSGRER